MYVEDTVKNFSRYQKYTIGTRLRDACCEVVTGIVKANNTASANGVNYSSRYVREAI